MKKRSKILLLACAAGACGDGAPRTKGVPWSDTSTVIDADGDVVATSAPDAQGGVIYDEFCIDVTERCADGEADILLDAKGKVAAALCYPPSSTIGAEQVDARSGEIAQNQNNTAIVLDAIADGADITGDVHVDGNNVILYGEGPAVSLLGGDLSIDGNNTIVRGVRVGGDVSVLKNNAVIAFATIDGSLTVSANNLRLYAVDILGDLTIDGNNAELVDVNVAGSFSRTGKGLTCADVSSFVDADADGRAAPTELGSALDC